MAGGKTKTAHAAPDGEALKRGKRSLPVRDCEDHGETMRLGYRKT